MALRLRRVRRPKWLDALGRLALYQRPLVDPGLLPEIASRLGATLVPLTAEDGVHLTGWWRPAAPSDEPPKAVLFLHGNAETLFDRAPLQDLLLDRGWSFFGVAWRGYPGSGATAVAWPRATAVWHNTHHFLSGLDEAAGPSEEGIIKDALAAWQYLVEERGIDPKRIVVHGKSLGGGAAAALASVIEPGALVLESTFTAVPDVLRDAVPGIDADSWLGQRFDTRARAPKIRCPVLVLHGDDDRVVPVRHGRALGTLFRDARYVELKGAGHGESLPVVEPTARWAYQELLDEVAR